MGRTYLGKELGRAKPNSKDKSQPILIAYVYNFIIAL
jgi:hypothetical protein